MEYYALYRRGTSDSACGIIVGEAGEGHFVLWDHRAGGWVYDPAFAVRFMDNHENWDRYDEVDRSVAELFVPRITGGEQLPDEETFRWIFRWRGEPPRNDG